MKALTTVLALGMFLTTVAMAQIRDYEPDMVIGGDSWQMALTRLEVTEAHNMPPFFEFSANPGEMLLVAVGFVEGPLPFDSDDVQALDRNGADLSRPRLRVEEKGPFNTLSPVQQSPFMETVQTFFKAGDATTSLGRPTHIIVAILENGAGTCLKLPDQEMICLPLN